MNWTLPNLCTMGILFLLIGVRTSYAANLLNQSDLMTRLKISTGSSHTVTFTLTNANTFAATETIILNFDEDGGGWVVDGVNATIADFDFNDGAERTVVGVDGDCSGHTGVNDVAFGINDTTGVITIEACANYTDSSAGATVLIEIGTAANGTDRITNPGTAATYSSTISGTFGDTDNILVEIVSDDQVAVTGTVDQTLLMSVSDATVGFGILTSTASRYATDNGSGANSESIANTLTIPSAPMQTMDMC